MNVLGMMERGRREHPGFLAGEHMAETACITCGQCSVVCPTDAIHEREDWREVLDLVESRRKTVVAMTAPAVRVAIGEEVGLAPGAITEGAVT